MGGRRGRTEITIGIAVRRMQSIKGRGIDRGWGRKRGSRSDRAMNKREKGRGRGRGLGERREVKM